MTYLQRFSTLLLSTLLTVAHANDSFAQASSPVPSFELYEHTFLCRFAKDARDKLEILPSGELQKILDDSIQETEEALKLKDLEKEEHRALRFHLQLLEKLKFDQSPKSKIQNFYQNLCIKSEPILKGGMKLTAHLSNVYQQGVLLPFRYLTRFLKGWITGKRNNFRQITWNEGLGHSGALGVSYYLLYEGYQTLASGSYALGTLYTTALVDTVTMRVCDLTETLSPEDRKFCENYRETKTLFFDMASDGQRLGAKLNQNQKIAVPEWNQPVNDQNYCEWLANDRARLDSDEVNSAVREAIVGSLNPGAMAQPKITRISTDSGMLVKTDVASASKLRNIIVSLSPPEETVQEIKKSGSLDRFLSLQKEVQSLSRQDEKLFRLKSIEKCQRKKEKLGFNYGILIEKQAELSKFKNEAFYTQHQLIEKQFEQTNSRFKPFGRTRLHWELVPSVTLNTLNDLLRSKDVGNVIIVTHSLENNKKMVDSQMNQIPTTFFGQFSPSLLSISFFTCPSDQYLDTYELQSRLKKTTSIHPERILNFVDNRGLLTDLTRAPLTGFRDYLRRVDRIAYLQIEKTMLSQAFLTENGIHHPELCSIELRDLKISQGSLALVLNRQFIGNLTAGEENHAFEFDCSLITESNRLKLQGVSMIENLKLETIPSQIILNGTTVQDVNQENFHDAAGNYSNSIYQFRGVK